MTITLNTDHDNPQDSQLIICITGTPEGIESAMKDMQRGTINWPSDYKPVQGTVMSYLATRSVITPVWNGERY